MIDNGYNGWKNRETWNASLWINNDEGLYRAAVDFMKRYQVLKYQEDQPYRYFIEYMELEKSFTGDDIHWLDSGMDYDALNDMMRDLID